jgi:hypothetical protein
MVTWTTFLMNSGPCVDSEHDEARTTVARLARGERAVLELRGLL